MWHEVQHGLGDDDINASVCEGDGLTRRRKSSGGTVWIKPDMRGAASLDGRPHWSVAASMVQHDPTTPRCQSSEVTTRAVAGDTTTGLPHVSTEERVVETDRPLRWHVRG